MKAASHRSKPATCVGAWPHSRIGRALICALNIVVGIFFLAAEAHADYSGALSSPTLPGAASTYTWKVSGVKPRPGQEIGHIELAGCWTADRVVSAKAMDRNKRAVSVFVYSSGPKANKIVTADVSDGRLPITITVTFDSIYAGAATGTDLTVKTGGGRVAGFHFNAGGPTCAPPSTQSLSIQAGSSSIAIPQGQSRNTLSTVDLTKTGGDTVNVQATTAIEPDNGGLGVTSDYPSTGYFASDSTTFLFNQSFRGNQPGTYTVTNTVKIEGRATIATSTILVTVGPPGGSPVILPLGSNPSGLQVGMSSLVKFTAAISNYTAAPAYLSLYRVDETSDTFVGELRDDGTGGDLEAGDGVYSGVFTLFEPNEGSLRFRASGEFPDVGERSSDIYRFAVSKPVA